ncbi:MAG TPA: PhaM family polyhydroxyalkanoate granule multifunctional regulatory protein [Methylibium sp.]
MSDRNASTPLDQALAFGKLVPGFDFLQGLVKNAGSALPDIGKWVAPTLNPDDLEKRIDELRTVQFWLEQNARMLAATIQALEVQRMTLSTLRSMNVPVDLLRDSLAARAAPAAAAGKLPAAKSGAATKPSTGKPTAEKAAAPVDPMQWWGALTKQFTELATSAMKEAAADSAKNLASGLAKQSFNAAEQTLKAGMAPAKKAAAVARKAAARKKVEPASRS